MLTKIYTYAKGKIKKYSSSQYYGETFEGIKYDKKAKKLIVYMGGTSSAYRGFQIKKGKLVITNAFQCKKIWKKRGNFNLSYYVNGKKVSEKKYNNKMNTLKNVKIKKYK